MEAYNTLACKKKIAWALKITADNILRHPVHIQSHGMLTILHTYIHPVTVSFYRENKNRDAGKPEYKCESIYTMSRNR
jgi:hypothetical protein